MGTHITAGPGDIAPRVLLPGDPLRAQWIAETYLAGVTRYSAVRGMYGFTGAYRGVPVSVQGTGMGMPSAAIYVHELARTHRVRTLVRVGSCGALAPSLGLRDLVAAIGAATDSAMNRVRFGGLVEFAPVADFDLLRTAVEVGAARGVRLRVGPVFSTDVFYPDPGRAELEARLADHGVLAVEMETAALYPLAARLGVRAVALLAVSDVPATGERLTPEERERSFGEMAEIALDTAVRVE